MSQLVWLVTLFPSPGLYPENFVPSASEIMISPPDTACLVVLGELKHCKTISGDTQHHKKTALNYLLLCRPHAFTFNDGRQHISRRKYKSKGNSSKTECWKIKKKKGIQLKQENNCSGTLNYSISLWGSYSVYLSGHWVALEGSVVWGLHGCEPLLALHHQQSSTALQYVELPLFILKHWTYTRYP